MDIPAWQAAEAASTAATVIMNICIIDVRTRGSGRGWSHVARVSAGLAAPGPARGYMLAGLEIPGSGRNPRGHSSPAELSLASLHRHYRINIQPNTMRSAQLVTWSNRFLLLLTKYQTIKCNDYYVYVYYFHVALWRRTDESDAEIIVSLCCLPCALELVIVAAGLTESLICVIIIMRQLTTGDKKLCVFQYDNKIDKA